MDCGLQRGPPQQQAATHKKYSLRCLTLGFFKLTFWQGDLEQVGESESQFFPICADFSVNSRMRFQRDKSWEALSIVLGTCCKRVISISYCINALC